MHTHELLRLGKKNMKEKNFRQTMKQYLNDNGVRVYRIEQEGDTESVIYHIDPSDNEKVNKIQKQMEKEHDVAVMLGNLGGMNVVIVESNNLEG